MVECYLSAPFVGKFARTVTSSDSYWSLLPKVPAKESPLKNETPFFLEVISGRLQPSLNLSEKKALQSLLTLNNVKSNVRMHDGQACKGTVHGSSFLTSRHSHSSLTHTRVCIPLRPRVPTSRYFGCVIKSLTVCRFAAKKIKSNFRKSLKSEMTQNFLHFYNDIPLPFLFSLLIL
jgi:hypothetical protein